MRKVAGEHPFCVLIYMNSYIFHIRFILLTLLSYLIFDFVCLTLSSADTHRIAKYARTYIRDTYTHAHTHTKNKSTKIRRKKAGKPKKRGGDQERKKEEIKKTQTEKGGKEGEK